MAGVAGLNFTNEINGCDTKQGENNPNESLANPKKCRTSRTVRKPVPQLSTCKECGEDFKYMRTLRTRDYCDKCNAIKYDLKLKKWSEKNNLKLDVDIPVRPDTVCVSTGE